MKYIINEDNSCGAASLSDGLRNQILESMGYTPNAPKASEQINESVAHETEVEDSNDMPSLYEWDGAVFALDEEVFEIEGDLFLKALELDSATRTMLDESHAELFINEVRFEEAPFSLGDIYDFGDEIYIKLDEGMKKGDMSKDKPDDKADYTTDARKGDKGHGKDKDDKGDFETGMRKGDKSNQKSKKGDKPDFTTDQRKGDKSKTHAGKDFMKKEANGDDMSDDDIDAAMNKNAPKDPKQVALRKKLKPAAKGKANSAAASHGDA
tara:strand:- start:605 stop:1405 length:801 start_codon:yes stop_codon:yes gene_type:complete